MIYSNAQFSLWECSLYITTYTRVEILRLINTQIRNEILRLMTTPIWLQSNPYGKVPLFFVRRQQSFIITYQQSKISLGALYSQSAGIYRAPKLLQSPLSFETNRLILLSNTIVLIVSANMMRCLRTTQLTCIVEVD
jgi:hypothetical protein